MRIGRLSGSCRGRLSRTRLDADTNRNKRY
jgi:hypothetical protein